MGTRFSPIVLMGKPSLREAAAEFSRSCEVAKLGLELGSVKLQSPNT